MRLLATAVALFLSASSFAHDFIYKGRGVWKHSDGQSGHFDALLVKSYQSDGSLRLKCTTTYGNHDFTHVLVVKNSSNGTATIHDADGNAIGSGYCFEKGDGHLCHMDFRESETEQVEMTLHTTLDTIKSMGSKRDAESRVMWMDSLKRIYPGDEGYVEEMDFD